MKIVVLNGSPKGNHGVTLQYVRFLEKKYKQHTFHVLNVAHDIRKIEADGPLFDEIIDIIRAADAVIWAFRSIIFLSLPSTRGSLSLSPKETQPMPSRASMPLQSPRPSISSTTRPTITFTLSAMTLE